jgi:hypothetical protein
VSETGPLVLVEMKRRTTTGRWFAPRVAVCLLCTQELMPKEDDSWARAPRVRDWAVGFGGDEEAHYRGRRFAPCMAVCLLRTRRPGHQLYDLWAQAPVS